MLRRNRFGFRMRRRSLTSRLLQFIIIFSVTSLFIYLLLYAVNFSRDLRGPDFTWLKNRNMTNFIRPNESTVLFEPTTPVCRAQDKLRLLIAVHSAPEHRERRRVIRKTWGSGFKTLPGVRIIFLFGLADTRQIQASLEQEHEQHNDLVQHNFIDSFANLTLKTTFLLKWILSNECQTSKFIFKTDDDTLVNPTQFWNSLDHALLHTTTTKALQPFVKSVSKTTLPTSIQLGVNPQEASDLILSESIDYLIMGYILATVPERDPNKKHYLPSRFYPLNIFPKYISGSGYVITSSIVPMLYNCMLRTPYMNLEDVMLSGLCATTQMGLKLTHNPKFLYKKPSVGTEHICYYKESAFIHGIDAAEMNDLWVRMSEEIHCDTVYFSLVQNLSVMLDFVKNIFRIE